MPFVSTDELIELAACALLRAGASRPMALATAQALVAADCEGLATHGVSRVALYVRHLHEGRVKGRARAAIVRRKGAVCLVDARGGLAYPATAVAVAQAIVRAQRHGIAFAGVTNSHHLGAVAYHLAPVAAAGLIGLAFTNSPPAITAWGGRKAFFGTNPIAAVFPRRGHGPVVIDLSLTEVIRGRIMLYAKEGKPIPPGWALDREGRPTTDAQAALTGSLSAIGGVKGVMLAFMVELLCAAVTGAAFSFENDSFFEPGNAPRIGHAFIAIDPGAVADADTYSARLEALINALLADEGVRLPGARRQQAAEQARLHGIEVPESLLAELRQLGNPVAGRS